jgi:hypothetical protein
MVIYKFTHKDTGRSYIGQTIQDPNHRKWEHITGSKNAGMTWEEIYGIEGARLRREAHKNKVLKNV